MVELQELVDAQLVAAGQASSPLRKAWRRRCLAQIGMGIQDEYAPLLQRCSQLIAAGENTDARVTEILAEADQFVAQVGRVCACVMVVVSACVRACVCVCVCGVVCWMGVWVGGWWAGEGHKE